MSRPNDMDRRQWMKATAASLALAGLGACRRPVEKIIPYVIPPEERLPGSAEYFATSMPMGLDSFGLLVECHDGRPTKVEGNDRHPTIQGRSNLWMQNAVYGLYDPDRSRSFLSNGQPSSEAEFRKVWSALEKRFFESRGEGLAVLSDAFASPTLSRLIDRFRERFPKSQWAALEPASDENRWEGIRIATGRTLQPVLRLERAEIIVSLGADPLQTETGALANAIGFSQRRSIAGPDDRLNRLYVIESGLSLTGANADARWAVPPHRLPQIGLALLEALRQRGLSIDPPHFAPPLAPFAQEEKRKIERLAEVLLAHRGKGVVTVGRSQPPALHAIATAIDLALGNVGQTVEFFPWKDANLPNRAGVEAMLESMEAGRVDTLIALGANPAYSMNVGGRWDRARKKIQSLIHYGTYVDETAAGADWHLPESHFLESWGDVRAYEGWRGVIQPTILPLFGGLSRLGLMNLLSGQGETGDLESLVQTWRELLPIADFDRSWHNLLRDGYDAHSRSTPITPTLDKDSLADVTGRLARRAAQTIPNKAEVILEVSPMLHDGRFAAIGQLQETPDPLSKNCWGNPVFLSASLAQRHGLQNGQIARFKVEKQRVEAPIRVLPGVAENTAIFRLGYGRRFEHRIAQGIGTDFSLLEGASSIEIEPLDRFEEPVVTQRYDSMRQPGMPVLSGANPPPRPLARSASLEEYQQNPGFAGDPDRNLPNATIVDHPNLKGAHQWGMTIDLHLCTGCSICSLACQTENNVPIVGPEEVRLGREMHWIRIDRYFEEKSDPSNPEVRFQPVACMHCEDAPCEEVCPVQATVHDQEGLNAMVYNRCIGTRYCSNNCPYKVRRFNYFNYTKDTPETLKMANNPDVTVRFRGVMEKCGYCLQRINAGKRTAKAEKRPLADGEIIPACAQACPSQAIVFGDLSDPESLVSKKKRDLRNYALLAELNIKPRTTYLAKVDNPDPDWRKG